MTEFVIFGNAIKGMCTMKIPKSNFSKFASEVHRLQPEK